MRTHKPQAVHAPLVGVMLLAAVLGSAHGLRAQPAELEGWTSVVSENFTMHTDGEPRRAAEIALNLERFRAVFARLAPELELVSPAPTRIFAFRDAESYSPYKTVRGPGAENVLGQFLSHRDGNFLTLNAGERRVGSFHVIFHEYVHYLVRHNFPGVPLWFNEGLAEYYSTFFIESGTAFVGHPVERHLRWLGRAGEIRLDDLIASSAESGRRHDPGEVGEFYATSWALVHFLLSGGGERLDQTAEFFTLLEDGEEAIDAFEDAFGTRLGRLEETLEEYIAQGEFAVATLPVEHLRASTLVSFETLAPADLLVHLGDLLARMGRGGEAERHFQRAIDLEPTHADAHAGLAFVRDLGERLEEANVLYRDALRLRSRSALTYLLYGRHLLLLAQAHADPESGRDPVKLATRARSVLGRAVELDPGFGEARALLGFAYLFGGEDPSGGIPHLQKASALMPERMDLVAQLLQLHLQAGDVEAARRLAEGPFRRRATVEMVRAAEEAIERTALTLAAQRALEAGEIDEGLTLFDRAVSITTDPDLRARMEERLLALQGRFSTD